MARYSKDKSNIIASAKIGGGYGSLSVARYGFNDGKEKSLGLYNSPYLYGNMGNFRWRPYAYANQETERSFNASERITMVALSRGLFAQMPILDFSLEQIAEWSIGDGYDIIYTGADKAFKAAFEDFANNVWAKNCNVLGPAFDFKTTLQILIKERLRDGDLLQVYEKNAKGLPQLRYLRSHRIASRNNETFVVGGRYDGFVIQDGVVKDGNGLAVGYYIQDPTNKEGDYIISVRDASLIFTPTYFDKTRGIPPLAPGILTGLSVQELHEYLQTMLKIESLIYLKKKTVSGEAGLDRVTSFDPPEDEPIKTATTPPLVSLETMTGGINYLSAPEGEDIESFMSNRPNSEAQDYIAMLETNLLSCLGWPHQLMFSTEDLSRAPARGITEIARKTILRNQSVVERFIKPAIVWAIGNAIGDGILPDTKEKWFNYIAFTKPAQFTLDAGLERAADINDYKIGLKTRDEITTKYGKRGAQVLADKTQETIDLWSSCVEAKRQLVKKYPDELKDLTVTQVHNDMQMLSANPLPEPESDNQEVVKQ